MKEIKFKVWNKENRTMKVVDVLLLAKGAQYAYIKTGKQREVVATTTYSDEVIMQYTGLKDKNGLQDVYEGDIIDSNGEIKGNIYENNAREIDLVIQGFGTKDWLTTYQKAMECGLKNSE